MSQKRSWGVYEASQGRQVSSAQVKSALPRCAPVQACTDSMAVAAFVLLQARDSNAEVMASFYRRAGGWRLVMSWFCMGPVQSVGVPLGVNRVCRLTCCFCIGLLAAVNLWSMQHVTTHWMCPSSHTFCVAGGEDRGLKTVPEEAGGNSSSRTGSGAGRLAGAAGGASAEGQGTPTNGSELGVSRNAVTCVEAIYLAPGSPASDLWTATA